jgi:hypothetical protein
MAERLRALLDRPLDPSAARAILAFASAILVGFAGLFVLAAGQPDQPTSSRRSSPASSSSGPAAPSETAESHTVEIRPARHRQDPQDTGGSTAARRADRALRSHRALQHIPYRDAHLAVRLVGARGDRAVLGVSAPTISAAQRGWRAFLRRYRDSGRAYLTRFEASGGHGG